MLKVTVPSESSSLLNAEQAANTALEEFKRAHDKKRLEHPEGHLYLGGYIKSAIFGGLDGVLTSFAVVAGAVGGDLSTGTVLILGISAVAADAFAMAAGDYLGNKAHIEYVLSEKAREQWEMKMHPEGEIQEMIDIFQSRGMNSEDAEVVVKIMAKYEDFFVDLMVTEELGLQLPEPRVVQDYGSSFTSSSSTSEEKHGGPIVQPFMALPCCPSTLPSIPCGEETWCLCTDAAIMFTSFFCFGLIPLLPYIIQLIVYPHYSEDGTSSRASPLVISSVIATLFALFTLGGAKSIFCNGQWLRSGLETMLVGTVCAVIGYLVGLIVKVFTDA